MQELWFLHTACCLTLIDTYMKFREDSLNSFQVKEWTQFCDRVQGEKLKKYQSRSYGSCTLHIL